MTKMMARTMAMACDRIGMSLSVRECGESEVEDVTDMSNGTIRVIDTAIIKDDIVFTMVLSNVTFFLP